MSKTRRELDAEARFRTYKAGFIKIYGRGPLDNEKIDDFGREAFKTSWRGVSGQDRVDSDMKPGYYILNSYTPSSPGYHWVAMHVTSGGKVHVYDSYARSAARVLMELGGRRKKENRAAMIDSDRSDAEQRGDTAVCGQLSLAWLMVVRDMGIRSALNLILP